jgi:hypothetical protein
LIWPSKTFPSLILVFLFFTRQCARGPSSSGEPTEEEELSKALEDIAEMKERGAEEREYEELTNDLTSALFKDYVAREAHMEVNSFMNRAHPIADAQALVDELADVLARMQNEHRISQTNYLGYEGGDIADRAQQLSALEASISATQKSLTDLCGRYNLAVPTVRPRPPISKETLQAIFNQALDMVAPGSELIQMGLGTKPMPSSRDEWIQVAVNTALGLLPGGKFLRLVRSSAVGKIQGQILRLATKRAKLASKAAKLSSSLLGKLQNIFKPGGKIIGKQLGKDPAIRTVSQEEAEKILKQLMDAGAKRVEKASYRHGHWYELPGGGGFGMRTKSSTASLKHRTPNTIDLQGLDLEIKKIKVLI